MNYVKFSLTGKYAHFRLPFANNAPMTYAVPPKSALVGLLGAIVGIEREVMKPLYKEFCEALKYSVAVLTPVKKVSHGFTLHSFHISSLSRAKSNGKAIFVAQRQKNDTIAYKAVAAPSPGNLEYLEDVSYEIVLSISYKASTIIKEYFTTFIDRLLKDEAVFPITLGARNCPAEVSFLDAGELQEKWGKFSTTGFVSVLGNNVPDLVLVENLPSRMIEDRHIDNKTIQRVYFTPGEVVESEGLSYTDTTNNSWLLI